MQKKGNTKPKIPKIQSADPEKIFLNQSMPSLNKLFFEFPDIDPIDFSNFLSKSYNNIIIIDYYFTLFYSIIKSSDDAKIIKTKEKLIHLLNSTDTRSLALLWEFIKERIRQKARLEKKVESYFELLEPENLQQIMLHFINEYKKKDKDDPQKKDITRTIVLLILFLNEDFLKKTSISDQLIDIFEHISRESLAQEIEILNHFNPNWINLLDVGKNDSVVRYEVTQYLNDQAEIDSILLMIKEEFDQAIKIYKETKIFDPQKFFIKKSNFYFTLKHFMFYFTIVESPKRSKMLASIEKDPDVKKMIHELNFETIRNLIQKNFCFLNVEEFSNKQYCSELCPLLGIPCRNINKT